MPIVSATDAPYQPFPTGRTSPQAPSDYQQIPTDVNEFGAIQGQALEKLGAQGEKLATSISNIAAYRQQLFNRTELDRMRMAEDDEIELARHGPKDPVTGQKLGKGFLDLTGSEAVNAGVPTRQLDDARARIAATAPNEEVRLMFMRQSRAARATANQAFDAHYERQLEFHNVQVQGAKAAQADRDATGGYNDDNALVAAMDKRAEAYVNASQDKDPEVLEGLRRKAHGEVGKTAIDAALAANDPKRADQLYQHFADDYSGEQKKHLRDQIQPKLDDLAAEGDADTVLRRNGLPGIPGAAGRGAAVGPGEAPGPPGPNAKLAAQRAPFANELKSNPALKKQLAALVDLENPEAGTAVVESLLNRMQKSGGTIASGIGGGGESFYGPVRRGSVDARVADLERDPQKLAARMRQIDQALAGSNIVRGYTDQGSKNDPNYEAGGIGINIAGERFNYHGGDTPEARKWREEHQAGIGEQVAQGPAATVTDAGAAIPGAPAAPPSPLMPLKTFEELEAELPTVDAQGNPISDAQQRKAVNRLRLAYNSHLASIRGEIANVNQLRKDDIASIEQTGQSIASVTPQRVAAAQGQAEADEHEEQRKFAQNYYALTNDFDHLPTFDLNRRLEQMRQAGAGQPGFERFQKNFLKAEQKVHQIEDLRRRDPSTAVARFPEVVAASQGADLANPQTYQPLVLARMKAMETIGLPPDAQIPITREEATILWRPIGEALRNGNERLARQEMEKLTRSLEAGWGGEDTKALGFILATGQANERVHDMAASALKALAKSHEPTPAQLRAADDARTGRSIAEAFGGIAPPPYPAPAPGESYLGQPLTGAPPGPPRPGMGTEGFTPGGAWAPPTAGPPAPSYPVPTPGHITNLRQHPETANQFDAVYGHGAASRVFGVAPAMAAPVP